ncbi:MAG: hypothetical protein ABJA62_08970 [Luteimonas sp.]
MSVEPSSVRSFLDQKVVLPSSIRIALAVVVMFGGLAFVVLGIALLFNTTHGALPHPVGAKLLLVAMAFMGAGFFWIGLRLVGARAASANLLSPAARVRCSFFTGALAVVMLIAAFQARNEDYMASAIVLVLLSYWLVPVKKG